jgi:asparagine synthase (glutamine-hydrolysing)
MSPRERHERQMSPLDREQRAALYSPEMLARINADVTSAVIATPWEAASGSDLVDILLETDVNTYLPDDLCVKVDIATMAYSLEARSPFLDHEFMEFAAALPPDAKMRGAQTKVALKDALVDWLPESILKGPKRGFNMPVVTQWFRGELRSFVSDILLDPQTLGRGYFREEAVRRLIDDHVDRSADNAQPLWALMMLELWHREFIDPAAISAGR